MTVEMMGECVDLLFGRDRSFLGARLYDDNSSWLKNMNFSSSPEVAVQNYIIFVWKMHVQEMCNGQIHQNPHSSLKHWLDWCFSIKNIIRFKLWLNIVLDIYWLSPGTVFVPVIQLVLNSTSCLVQFCLFVCLFKRELFWFLNVCQNLSSYVLMCVKLFFHLHTLMKLFIKSICYKHSRRHPSVLISM